MTLHGEEYKGSASTTVGGLTCQRWDSQYPHTHDEVIYEGENFCRNPGGRAPFPWCFTTERNVRWQLCDIPFCDAKLLTSDCRLPEGVYRGQRSTTISGHMCQAWDAQIPHPHDYNSTTDFGEDIHEAANFCRRLGNEQFPWCYTTDPNVKWEYCDIPLCTSAPKPNLKMTSTGMLILFGCAGGVAFGIIAIGLFATILTIRRIQRNKLDQTPMTPLRMIPLSTAPTESYNFPDPLSMTDVRMVSCNSTITPRTIKYYKRCPRVISPTRCSAPPTTLSRSFGSLLTETDYQCQNHGYLQIITEDVYPPMNGRMSVQPVHRDTM